MKNQSTDLSLNLNNIKFSEFQKHWFNTDAIDLREYFTKNISDINNPTKQELKAFNLFLDANKDKNTIVFHGTNAKHDILTEGLKKTNNKNKSFMKSQVGYVYTTLYPSTAQMFGEFASNGENVSVYAIKIPIKHLKSDSNQLESYMNLTNTKVTNTLVNSLVLTHCARIKKDLELCDVRKVWTSCNEELNVA
ncbi:hypothetical protein [Poseidonibacter ostreae]|uniref:Uncharacterized protein n=1 Tax=Poseidonibacter ostreae TaxID=2654171 RepID=A0A6L4WWP5_9BACT|nr:hypothetical protein [Poseidonibacter ostreae]KAB7891456.1 hypothetical protein GBG19_01045 [Poseidonibacter ostreae]